MKPLVATIWHTGTNYLLREFKRSRGTDCELKHTGHELWMPFDPTRFDGRRIITTMRDPWSVAASWANRYDMNSPEYIWHWKTVWTGWERLLTYEPEIRDCDFFTGKIERSVGDLKGCHAMLANDDFKTLFTMISFDLIQFAIEIYGLVDQSLIVPEPK
jgi:hypothetical protein